jgi:hypothetical protein
MRSVQHVVQCQLEGSSKRNSHQFSIAKGLTASPSCLILACLTVCSDIFSELLFTSYTYKLHMATLSTA